MVVGERIVQLDRRARAVRDEAGVRARFGVGPASIPDLLALVGDAADGFPGLPGWGAKSAAAVLARYETIEAIPREAADWDVRLRNGPRLAQVLADQIDLARLFRTLATLRVDAEVGEVGAWRWVGPRADFEAMCARLDAPELADRARTLAGVDPML